MLSLSTGYLLPELGTTPVLTRPVVFPKVDGDSQFASGSGVHSTALGCELGPQHKERPFR